ncbi:MAG: ACP S-malonyltransferase [Kordiimonadaceae bacterium]|nr:ACP S-malonyltransferase [Kordiimonadaceae bacterium]
MSMFPGQGAQKIGMGADLFGQFPDLTSQADAILGYSIQELCVNGPLERQTQTQNTQPALYVVNALQYLASVETEGCKPDYLLGHSVSEYVALFAAGVLDFQEGLRLVQKRGELMGQVEGGGMAAVLGLTAEEVEALIKQHGLTDIYAANFNTPKQIVVSGKRDMIIAAEPLFMEAGAALYKVLAVSGAFHTPFMEPSKLAFAKFAADIPFAEPNIPVIANVTARPHGAESIRDTMVAQITSPVQWSESIRYLLAKGLQPTDFTEIGPKGAPILKPMVKRTQMEAGPLEGAILEKEQAAKPVDLAPQAENPSQAIKISRPEKQVNGTKVASPERRHQGVGIENLGSRDFCESFSLKYPYISGAMYRGIASSALVIRMAKAGMLGFLGAGGLSIAEIEHDIQKIQQALPDKQLFGVNFIAHFNRPEAEETLTDLLLECGVAIVEASAFMEVTPALVRYRAKGLRRVGKSIEVKNRIIAKVSRPDIAAGFLSAPPERLLEKMLADKLITQGEAELLRLVPMADAITVESDSGGHTDQGMPFTLIPAVLKVRQKAQEQFSDFGPIFVGAGGGIGTPEAAAAVFMLGADYVVTGSINQCTVEAGTSDAVKDMLASANVYDTGYAPSGAMFELGSRIQVLKKGLFFPTRAEKLVSLYHQHGAIERIEEKLSKQIQERYFKRSFDDVLNEIQADSSPQEWEKIERTPKYRMGQVIRRYFSDTTRWAVNGDVDHKVDFQIHCGPAQGALNQWLHGTELQNWRNRHADELAISC